MAFLNKNLLSIYLLFILFLITISFVNNRKQIRSLILIPFKTKESYDSLYFQRNINFSFLRLNFVLLTISISNCFVINFTQEINSIRFFLMLLLILVFYFIRHVSILLWGFVTNKYVKCKKISIVVIDTNAFISLYFLPFLFIAQFNNFINLNILSIISILYILLIAIAETFFIIKNKNLIDLERKDIILYICAFEIIPIIAFYITL